MKKVKAVQPYLHSGHLNFKQAPYNAWMKLGGQTVKSYFPPRLLHGLVYRIEIPSFNIARRLLANKDEAILIFIEPVSLQFDTFPYYVTNEIIPFIWDCWPCYYDKMEKWLKKHKVKTAIFTSNQEMEELKKRVPNIHYIHCPEAVDISLYKPGKVLKDRSIDFLEFGRSNERVLGKDFSKLKVVNHVCTKIGNQFIYSNEQLYDAMANAKVTICLPKSITHPQIAEGVETLTQRYWEAMLSKIVIVGHCPKELEILIGYNPVVEISNLDDPRKAQEQILNTLEHIETYQDLVNKNREIALKMGGWKTRMFQIVKCLADEYRI